MNEFRDTGFISFYFCWMKDIQRSRREITIINNKGGQMALDALHKGLTPQSKTRQRQCAMQTQCLNNQNNSRQEESGKSQTLPGSHWKKEGTGGNAIISYDFFSLRWDTWIQILPKILLHAFVAPKVGVPASRNLPSTTVWPPRVWSPVHFLEQKSRWSDR